MKKKPLKSVLSLLFLLCLINSTLSQTVIYQQNFDGNNGTFTNAIVSQVTPTNGWLANNTAAQFSTYRHVWNFSSTTTGPSRITGRSLGMGFYNGNNPNVTNQNFRTWDGTNCNQMPLTTRWAHVGVSTIGYQNISIEFKWRCTGEVDAGTVYDYGTVISSIDGGTTWLMDETGGQGGTTGTNGVYAGGLYYGNTNVLTQTISLPASRNNQSNFRIGFRMVVDECFGTGGSFIIDDIIVRGNPLSTCSAGTASGPGFVQTNNTASLSLSGSTGTTVQWQSSLDGIAGWTNVAAGTGATSANYTTAALANGTYYFRAMVTDGGSCTQYSNTVQFYVAATPNYCNGAGSGNATLNNHVESIAFHEWLDPTVGGTNNYVSNNYLNYTDTATYGYATVIAGQYHHLNALIRAQGTGTNGTTFAYWIDWNGDGTFTNTAFSSGGERIDNIFYTNTAGNTYASYFTVPATLSGTVRIRVRAVRGNIGNLDPCNAYTASQTKDFTIKIIPSIGNQVCNGVLGTANLVSTNSTADKVYISRVKVDGPLGTVLDNNGMFFGGQIGATVTMYNYSNFMGYDSNNLQLESGQSYTMQVEHSGFTCAAGLFIDWNGDGDFLDLNEIAGRYSDPDANPFVFNFIVPSSVTDGQQVAMRVRLRYDDVGAFGNTIHACNSMTSDGLQIYSEVEDYRVTLRVATLECSGVSNLQASIGMPANGSNHHLNVTWTGLSGATGYDIEYSSNGSSYIGTTSVSMASYDFNAGDNPNSPYWFRVRAKDGIQTCDWTYVGPIYTAADAPAVPLITNAAGVSLDLTIQNETPVANSAITTYSIYCTTTSQFVQANGTLGATEVFQTKAAWGTITVTGLTTNTNYCFSANAKNNDGHVVNGTVGISGLESFTTNANFSNSVSNGPTNRWWTPGSPTSGTPMSFTSTGGCDGGYIGFSGSFNNFFGSFLRSPQQNCIGLETVTMTFDLSNSYFASHSQDRVHFNMWAPTAAQPTGTYINAATVNGAATATLYFNQTRNCQQVIVTFNLSSVTDKSAIMFYLNVNCDYNNSNVFSFKLDDISILQPAPTACAVVAAAPTPVFYNHGGTTQLAFNNSRSSSDTPVFRLSHALGTASNYQIEINTAAAFNGTAITQTFNGSYAANSQQNYTHTSATGQLVNGTTYYVRARINTGLGYGFWTTGTYSFTYNTTTTSVDWFQTTQTQFQTGTLSGAEANASNNVVASSVSGGGSILNASFETNSNWTTFTTGGSQLVTVVNDAGWSSQGSRAARMYMFGGFALSGDIAVISQVVDLTGVEQIIFDARSFYGQNLGSSLPNGGTLRLIIGGTSSNATGITVATINHCASGSSSCNVQVLNQIASIPSGQRLPNQRIKFVWTGFSQGDLGGALVDFMVDNVRAISVSSGTITSPTIYRASKQNAPEWENLNWNQTLNGGTASLKVQKVVGGIWTDVAGLNNITAVGDGLNTQDISSLGAGVDSIRVVATLAGTTSPVLHDWSIKAGGCLAPEVTTQPADVSLCSGGNTSFTISATGDAPLEYQWQVSTNNGQDWNDVNNGGVYSNATAATININGVTLGMSGYLYRAVVTNDCGEDTSDEAELDVPTCLPIIDTQPTTSTIGCTVGVTSMTVAAADATGYQWQVSTNGGGLWINLTNAGKYSGVDTPTLNISNPTAAMSGYQYQVVVSNSNGSVTSTVSTLTVQVCPSNDNPLPSNPTLTSVNYVYPNCNNVAGTTVGATLNPATGTRDVWYQFLAMSNGVSIRVSSTEIDPVIYLFNGAATTMLNEESIVSGTLTEVLNYGSLTPGQVYRIAVASENATDGAFSLCMQQLRVPNCGGSTGYSLCSVFSSNSVGATSTIYSFTQGVTTTSLTSSSPIPLGHTALGLQYGTGYTVGLTANYVLANGLGEEETIQVVNSSACSITTPAQPPVEVKSGQRCSGGAVLYRSSYLQGVPVGASNVCGVTGYVVEFTELGSCNVVDITGIPFTKMISSPSANISLSYAFNGLTPVSNYTSIGYWKVRWRPIFGSHPGIYGTAYAISVNGTAPAGMLEEPGDEMNGLGNTGNGVAANVYPNPNNGEMVNLNMTGITSPDVFVRIMDSMGRVVYTNRYSVDGSLNTIATFSKPLAGGLYMIEFTTGDELITQRMMVTR